MTQDTWQYQGRQSHGWFGHGTGPHADAPAMRQVGREDPPAPPTPAARATHVAYGVLGHLPPLQARSYEAKLAGGMLGHYQRTVETHPATAHLSDAAYAATVTGGRLSPEEAHALRQSAALTHAAHTLDDLAPASTALAGVVQSAGVQRTSSALALSAKGSESRESRELLQHQVQPLAGLERNLYLAANNSAFHDKVRDEYAAFLKSKGCTVETEVAVVGYAPDPVTKKVIGARVDIMARAPGHEMVAIEFKTGENPPFTWNQRVTYPQLLVGHTYSPDSKIKSFGFQIRQPLPPTRIVVIYKKDEQSEQITGEIRLKDVIK